MKLGFPLDMGTNYTKLLDHQTAINTQSHFINFKLLITGLDRSFKASVGSLKLTYSLSVEKTANVIPALLLKSLRFPWHPLKRVWQNLHEVSIL